MDPRTGILAAGGAFGVLAVLRCCCQRAEEQQPRRQRRLEAAGAAVAGDAAGRAGSPSPCGEEEAPPAARPRGAAAGRPFYLGGQQLRASASLLSLATLAEADTPRGSDTRAAGRSASPAGAVQSDATSPRASHHPSDLQEELEPCRTLEHELRECRQRLAAADEARDELEATEEQLRLELAQLRAQVRSLQRTWAEDDYLREEVEELREEARTLEGVEEREEQLRFELAATREEVRTLQHALEQHSALRQELAEAADEVRGLEGALELANRGVYDSERVLGAGSFGTVELIRRRSDGVLFVRKTARASQQWPLHRVLNEVLILSQVDHPNCMRLLSADVDAAAGTLALVAEYAAGGDLRAWWHREGTTPKGVRIYRDICGALQHLHRKFIVHHDVKPENILVRADGTGVLADFGLAMATEGTAVTVFTGTQLYMAPELHAHRPHTGSADVWSFGCVLHQLSAGWEHPWDSQSGAVCISPAVGFPMRIWVIAMLDDEPGQRPSAHALVEWYEAALRNGQL
eukprot:TRINITY_DN18512_c0_g3_i1.p1 TRINITY_DN18512_c0_g3~~TRINITY_DN18512_c0_g3_i1.p1  ORF type:complete len:520 (+),score=139.73 TRINITY_DN18512_c0_g3_i1:73-1632(+)